VSAVRTIAADILTNLVLVLRDELYDEALRIVLDSGQASISMIQRRLRIGYNRSARMVEQMERERIVTPADGARPREVRTRPDLPRD
jgi:S-DNA-T family DNA segregation ATPase FtsK/SpoIIIE